MLRVSVLATLGAPLASVWVIVVVTKDLTASIPLFLGPMCLAMLSFMNFVLQIVSLLTVTCRFPHSMNQLSDLLHPNPILLLLFRRVLHRMVLYSFFLLHTHMLRWFLLLMYHLY